MSEVMAGSEETRFLDRHYRERPVAVLTRWREQAVRVGQPVLRPFSSVRRTTLEASAADGCRADALSLRI